MTQYGLGRRLNHDPRSRNFAAPAPGEVKSIIHAHSGEWLNQGLIGSCTGNALAQALNCRPNRKRRARTWGEPDALRWYAAATDLDPFPGRFYWPAVAGAVSEDTGSDGNSVCKAARAEGVITSWQHAFGLDHMLRTLQVGPVIVGTNWYESMFELNSRGVISVSGEVVGGHEWLVYGVNMRDAYLWAGQSWGDWGPLHGRFKVPFAVMDRLLKEDGDVILPTGAVDRDHLAA